MQTTTIIKTVNTSINPFQSEKTYRIESLASTTRFNRLSDELKEWADALIQEIECEREIISAVDAKFTGELIITTDKDGVKHQWQGYSKIADIVIEEYQSRLKGRH